MQRGKWKLSISATEAQVPLQLHEVTLLGPTAEGPLSDYHNVQRHAVELVRSENMCRNNQCQDCVNISILECGDCVR